MGPDAGWLNILKASSWQFACLAAACMAALFVDARGWLPISLDANFKQGTMLAAFGLAGLWLASVGSALAKSLSVPIEKMKRKRRLRDHAEEFRKYIPFMPPDERAVLAQLLHENHKSFTADIDGGYAAPLIARDFIRRSLAPGQGFSADHVPFLVPDHIWEVMVANRAEFVHRPSPSGADAWRKHWMLR